jgi:predicted RNA-binding Zn ribbon-like protein
MAPLRRRDHRFLLVGGRLAIDFANTVHSPATGGDAFARWDDVAAFLVAAGTPAGPGREGDPGRAFARALALRRVIRDLLAAMTARKPPPPASVEVVNEVLRTGAGHERLVADGRGWRLEFAPGRDDRAAALALVARSAAMLITEGRAAAVKRCGNPRCVLFFRDDSRGRRRRWCSMAVCGNRMKVAAHARRRRLAATR